MSDDDTDYEVGYKKPPKHTQFVPGQSGNKGRRKRPESQAEMIARIRDETIEVNGKQISKLELILQQSMHNAIRTGKPKDAIALIQLFEKYAPIPPIDEGQKAKEGAEQVYNKIMNSFYAEEDIDEKDVDELDRLRKEEAKMVMACPHCGPELKQSWALPERKELSRRYGKTGLHNDVTDKIDRKKPFG